MRPDVIEELGGVSNLLFPLERRRVTTDATRAAIEAASDDDATLLADDRRARFCASIDGRRQVVLGEEIELAVDHRHLHFFDPETRCRDHGPTGSRPAERRRSSVAERAGERRRHEVERASRRRTSSASLTAPPIPVGVLTASVAYSTAQRSRSAGSAPRRSAQM